MRTFLPYEVRKCHLQKPFQYWHPYSNIRHSVYFVNSWTHEFLSKIYYNSFVQELTNYTEFPLSKKIYSCCCACCHTFVVHFHFQVCLKMVLFPHATRILKSLVLGFFLEDCLFSVVLGFFCLFFFFGGRQNSLENERSV